MATAMGTVGLGATLAGGVLSAFGAKASADSTSKMYQYQAQVAKFNSDIDKQNASYALQVGDKQELNYGLQAGQKEAAIRTAQGASGLDVNSGSNAEVQRSQRQVAGMDMDTIRANAAKTAYDYDVKSVNDVNQAGLYSLASSNAEAAGNINMASSLISTAGSVANKWSAGTQSGLFGGGSSYGGGMGISLGATGGLY